MKRLFFLLLAVLLIAGTGHAISIPQSEDAETGPAVWMVPVFNNSGGTMDVGDVAVWQISSSTGDNDNYVTTTTTADTYLVAGVIYPADIADQDRGTMAVHGVVPVDIVVGGDVDGNPANSGGLLCTSTTAGSANICSGTTTDADGFAFTTGPASAGSVGAFIFGR